MNMARIVDVAFPHIKVINIDEAMLLLNPKALA